MAKLCSFSLLLSLLLATATADATLVRAFSMRGLTTEAHSVVRAEVIDQETVYDARRGRVYTHTFVQVLETLAGSERVGDVLVVRQMGGVLDGVQSRVVGTVEFRVGDEVLLFARTDGTFHYLVGMSQGAWSVRRPATGPAVLARDLGGVRLVDRRRLSDPPPPEQPTLIRVRGLVAEILAEEAR